LTVVAAAYAVMVAPTPTATAATSVSVSRMAGPTRYETAADVALGSFTSAADAVLARGDLFPDALAAAYLAGAVDAPILLTPPHELHPAAASALERLGVHHVWLAGDETALGPEVAAELDRRGISHDRVGGVTRYDTAAQVAEAQPDSVGTLGSRGRTALVASGENFPDALAAGPLSYGARFPLLLTERQQLPGATQEALSRLAIRHVVIVGGPNAISLSVDDTLRANGITVQRVGGADRTQTAALLAWFGRDLLGWPLTHANLARGDAFPDAVAGAPHAGREHAPILLTAGPSTLGRSTQAFLNANITTIETLHAFGDATAISDQTLDAARAAATKGATCPEPTYGLRAHATPDPRVCITLTITNHFPRSGVDAMPATLTVENRSGDTIDITHQSTCELWYGLFAATGEQVGGGPSRCDPGPVPDSLAPHQTRTWNLELHTCYGRSGDTGSNCIEGSSLGGTLDAGVGLNLAGGPAYVAIGNVWYAPEQPIAIQP
jgi:putative cell wall-binding protein